MYSAVKKKIKSNDILKWAALSILRIKNKIRPKISGKRNCIDFKLIFGRPSYDIIGNNNILKIGQLTSFGNVKIFIRGNNNLLEIGKNVNFLEGSIRFEGSNSVIKIGDNTTISSSTIQAIESGKKVEIGEDCMLSIGVNIWTSDFHAIIDNNSMQVVNKGANVAIGNHVWIGAFVTILKGTCIGNDCIIAANSVVCKGCFNENNVILGGNPSKIIKRNINWSRIKPDMFHSSLDRPM